MATDTQQAEPVQTNFKIDPAVRELLDLLAQKDRRSMTGEIHWLIEQEAARRGITSDADAA